MKSVLSECVEFGAALKIQFDDSKITNRMCSRYDERNAPRAGI